MRLNFTPLWNIYASFFALLFVNRTFCIWSDISKKLVEASRTKGRSISIIYEIQCMFEYTLLASISYLELCFMVLLAMSTTRAVPRKRCSQANPSWLGDFEEIISRLEILTFWGTPFMMISLFRENQWEYLIWNWVYLLAIVL